MKPPSPEKFKELSRLAREFGTSHLFSQLKNRNILFLFSVTFIDS